MDYIIDNWYMFVAFFVLAFIGIITVVKWLKLSSNKKYEQIRGWLLQAVLLAEKEFGGGTGKLKLSTVYDKFCERFPWLARVLPFDTFKKYVDDALAEMKTLLEGNDKIAHIVDADK